MTAEAIRCLYCEMSIRRSWMARVAGEKWFFHLRRMTGMAPRAGYTSVPPAGLYYVIYPVGVAFHTVAVGGNNL